MELAPYPAINVGGTFQRILPSFEATLRPHTNLCVSINQLRVGRRDR